MGAGNDGVGGSENMLRFDENQAWGVRRGLKDVMSYRVKEPKSVGGGARVVRREVK